MASGRINRNMQPMAARRTESLPKRGRRQPCAKSIDRSCVIRRRLESKSTTLEFRLSQPLRIRKGPIFCPAPWIGPLIPPLKRASGPQLARKAPSAGFAQSQKEHSNWDILYQPQTRGLQPSIDTVTSAQKRRDIAGACTHFFNLHKKSGRLRNPFIILEEVYKDSAGVFLYGCFGKL